MNYMNYEVFDLVRRLIVCLKAKRYTKVPPIGHFGGESVLVAILTCILVSSVGVSLSKLQNATFQGLFSSEKTMQAQHYASTKMDYLVYNGYGRLSEQQKEVINDSNFKDEVVLGNVSTNADGISYRTVTINVYSQLPRP